MFWGPLEGLLIVRIHFGLLYDSQYKMSFSPPNVAYRQYTRIQREKICHFEVTHDSECDLGAKKRMKYQNNIRDVFRHTKFPLGNEMIHWNELL